MASHLVVLLIAVSVLWLSRKELPKWDIGEADVTAAAAEESVEVELSAETSAAGQNVALVRAAVPITLIPERPRIDIITYTVQAGNTLYGIAQKYKLSAETIMFANGLENNPDLLRLGQQLTILPVDGILHTVKQGDTLEKIAKAYKTNAAGIVSYSWNKLDARNPAIARRAEVDRARRAQGSPDQTGGDLPGAGAGQCASWDRSLRLANGWVRDSVLPEVPSGPGYRAEHRHAGEGCRHGLCGRGGLEQRRLRQLHRD